MSNTAPGIDNIARIARDNMQMEVEDRLTCCRAFVEADVETVWMETL